MYPDRVFGLFYMYGLMIAIGLVMAFVVLFYYGKKKGVEDKFIDFIFYNGILSIIVGFGSATLFQAFYNYLENPSAGFNLGNGFTFIGGLIGGVICFLIIYFFARKRYKTRLTDVLSAPPCCIMIGHAFGRIGCFFAGCCYGKETDSFLGVQFPHLPNPVHPTMLYESAFLFILFGITFYLLMKKNFRHNMSVYLIAYGIFRFCNEYLRGDHRGELVGNISPSQFWSLAMIVLGVALYFLLEYLRKHRPTPLMLQAQGVAVEEPSETEEKPSEKVLIAVETKEMVENEEESKETEAEQ